jgi:D-alanyl-D-alanine carboxypeptidase
VGDNGVITPGTRRPNVKHRGATGSAAGGSYATVCDLLRFDRALRPDVLQRQTTTRRLLTGQIGYGRPGYRYAYGFGIRTIGAERIAGHSGGSKGIDAQFEMYLDSDYTMIVLANEEAVAEPIMLRVVP